MASESPAVVLVSGSNHVDDAKLSLSKHSTHSRDSSSSSRFEDACAEEQGELPPAPADSTVSAPALPEPFCAVLADGAEVGTDEAGPPATPQRDEAATAIDAFVEAATEAYGFGDAASVEADEAQRLWDHVIAARSGHFRGFPSPQPVAGLEDWVAPECPSPAEWEYMRTHEDRCFGFFGLDAAQRRKYEELARRVAHVSCVGCRWNLRFVELIRYLRNCKFDVTKTVAKIAENAAWRQEQAVDDILEAYVPPFSVLKHYAGWGLEAEDSEGFPIFTWKVGKADLIGLLRTYSSDDLVRYAIWEREWFGRVLAYRRATQPEKTIGYGVKVMIIADLEGLGMRHLSGGNLDAFARIMGMDQQRYPEAGFRTVVVRAPRIFSAVFGIVRSLFQNQDEILIRSGDAPSVLTKFMAAENIPAFLGGRNAEITSPGSIMTAEDIRKAKLEKEARDRVLNEVIDNEVTRM